MVGVGGAEGCSGGGIGVRGVGGVVRWNARHGATAIRPLARSREMAQGVEGLTDRAEALLRERETRLEERERGRPRAAVAPPIPPFTGAPLPVDRVHPAAWDATPDMDVLAQFWACCIERA